MVQRYNKTPSELMHVYDEYDAYCLDEACAYIMSELDSGKTFASEKPKKHFKSASDLYKSITGR